MREAVAAWSPEHPITVHSAGAHAVFRLLGVLLALMLADARQQVFDQDRVAVLPELHRGTFQPGTGARNGFAQIEVGLDVPRQTADVVDDNNKALRVSVFLEIREHRLHAGTGRDAAGHRFIDENPVHVITLHAGEFTAAGFLRSQALAFADLCGRRHAGIDDGLRV
ncbi:MAG: hypothetical protein P8Y27_02615 [Chromatiaceae bacterium]